ncbi:hypothetical protein T484DRAFT_1822006, partial [Baffinella frigidus]
PVYSATKAAIHNYTMALRYSLEPTQVRVLQIDPQDEPRGVRVVEIIPPAVKSNLGGSHDFGEECDVFCAAVMARVAAGELEVGFGFSESGRVAGRVQIGNMMTGLAKQMHSQQFADAE